MKRHIILIIYGIIFIIIWIIALFAVIFYAAYIMAFISAFLLLLFIPILIVDWKFIKYQKKKKLEREKEKSEKMREERERIKREREEEERKERERAIEKIKEMIEVSTRLKLEFMRKALKIDEDSFTNNIFKWAKEFGFTIDGEYLVVNKETVSDFIEMLDDQFASWEKQKGKK